MKTRRALIAVSITALVVAAILISLKAYYVTIALIVGALLLGHREFWSLVRRRKLPPIDERVQGNISKSVRNGFIFLEQGKYNPSLRLAHNVAKALKTTMDEIFIIDD